MNNPTSREFDNLCSGQYQRLYTLAFRMTGNREDTEDVLQTAFLNAWKGWDGFRGDSSAGAWLYRIVVNTARRAMKNERRLPVTIYAEEHNLTETAVYRYINEAGDSEDAYLIERVKQSCLQMFMNCMPGKYRVVFTLRVILGLSVRETADILECSEAVVKTDLHRARKLVSNHFDGRCSLVRSDGPCVCSTFACHIMNRGDIDKLQRIRAIPVEEIEAKQRYQHELEEILDHEALYLTEIHGRDRDEFLQHIRNLRAGGKISILSSGSSEKSL